MRYACLKFEDTSEVEAVPHHWITGDVCYYPSFKDPAKNSRAIKEGHQPQEKWTCHKIKIYKIYGKCEII